GSPPQPRDASLCRGWLFSRSEASPLVRRHLLYCLYIHVFHLLFFRNSSFTAIPFCLVLWIFPYFSDGQPVAPVVVLVVTVAPDFYECNIMYPRQFVQLLPEVPVLHLVPVAVHPSVQLPAVYPA